MSQTQPFCPSYGSGKDLTGTSESQIIDIRKNTKQYRIVNDGLNPVYIKVGQGAITASEEDLKIPGGAIEVFTKFEDFDKLAYISPSGTTFNLIMGEGW
jgi:hypothetical protein